MSKYKGFFTYDIDNHRYIPIEQADGIISDKDYCPEPKGMKDVYVSCFCKNGVMIEFETEEEAELAVRKLKAWKRLKDKGFRVIDYGDEDIRYEIKDRYDGCLFDLETALFGGEE